MKHYYKNILLHSFIFLSVLSGCDSFRMTADEYMQSGNDFIEKSEFIQASLQFRNAIQIDKDMTAAWYGLSLAEEGQGQMNKVYVLLNKVLELDPSHVDARIKRGKIFLLGKMLDKALDDSNKLLKLAPNNAAVHAFRASVLLNVSDNKGALKEANLALKIDPVNIDALIVLATEKMSSGDAAAAISYLDKGIAINEKNLVLQLLKIKALDGMKEHEQVIAIFQRLIILYPGDNSFSTALVQYYVANNELSKAEKVYRDAVKSEPEDIAIKLELAKFIFKQRGADEAITLLERYVKEDSGEIQLQFALAELFQISKKFNEAEKVYKVIIDKYGSSPDGLSAKNKIAAIYLSQSKLNESRQVVNQVLAFEPSNSASLLLKATLDIQQGRIDTAVADLRTVLKNEPDLVNGLVLLARAHLKNNAKELANKNYLRAVQIEPSNDKVAIEYANFLLTHKEINQAEAILMSLLEKVPNSLPALQAMARLKLSKGDWQSAHALAEQIKLNGGQQAVIEQILGAVYLGQQKYEQSISAYKRAHQASPSSVQPIVALVRSYVRSGKHKEAHYFLKSVLEIHPSNLYALVLIGQGHLLKNETKQAEVYFKRAVETNPTNALGYLELVKLYSKTQRYRLASKVGKQGLAKIPENIPLQLANARVLEHMDQFEQAIAIYEHILKNNPGIELAANNLASLLADHYAGNEKSLRRALEVTAGFENSANPYFRDTIGWVHYRLGQADKATSLFINVTNAVPEMPVFHYHLGMSQLAQGNKAAAKASLLKARSLSNKNLTGMKDLNEVLKRL